MVGNDVDVVVWVIYVGVVVRRFKNGADEYVVRQYQHRIEKVQCLCFCLRARSACVFTSSVE